METPNTGIVHGSSYQRQIENVDFVFKALNKQINDMIEDEVEDLSDATYLLNYISTKLQKFDKIKKQVKDLNIEIVGLEKIKQAYCYFQLSKQLLEYARSHNKDINFMDDIKEGENIIKENMWFLKVMKDFIAKSTTVSFQSNIESRFNFLLNGGSSIVQKSQLVENMSRNQQSVSSPSLPKYPTTKESRKIPTADDNLSLQKPRLLSPSLGYDDYEILDKYSRAGCIEIQAFLNTYSELDSKILLIDFRSSFSFLQNHISLFSNIINIEPISLKPHYTIQDVYNSSLILASNSEKKMFQSLPNYELIIIFDESTTTTVPSFGIDNLTKILYDNNVDPRYKPKRRPVFLNGGFNAWSKFMSNQTIDTINDTSSDYSYDNYIHTPSHTLTRSPSPSHAKISKRMQYGSHQGHTFSDYSYSGSEPISPTQNRYPQTNTGRFNAEINSPLQSNATLAGRYPNNNAPKTSQISSLRPRSSSNNLSSVKKEIPIISGLFNLGNSCYLNSVLQCLVGTDRLIKFLLGFDYQVYVTTNSNLGSKGKLTKEIHNVANSMLQNTKNHTITNPKNFKYTVGRVSETFNNNHQQDAAEFLHFILDTMHEDLNWSANKGALPIITTEDEANREILPIRLASTIEWERYLKTDYSPIVELFSGQYASRLECGDCHRTSTTYIPFNMLSVPIPSNAKNIGVIDCIKKFVSPEILTKDNVWKCTGCKSSKCTKKQLTITRLPSVLIIHLERFSISKKYQYVKNDEKIDVPLNLDMNEFWPKIKDFNESEQLKKFPDRQQSGDWKYKLFGIIRHHGTLNGGHYVSEVAKHDDWVLFDDSNVKEGTRNRKPEQDGSAYILFYVRSA